MAKMEMPQNWASKQATITTSFFIPAMIGILGIRKTSIPIPKHFGAN